ncbi:hypothetical protein QN277_006202 [Acacia crassicarpa]|nr:hypothetical protein QN277_006202 [Acacia crassicarpa]
MPYLPDEIITNILKRLPVKSLIRFQCVCTHWKNLIKNPSFIADHLQQSGHQNSSLLLLEWNRRDVHWRLLLLDCGMQVREIEKAFWIDSLAVARIIGSCNGLLCVEIRQYNKFPPSLLVWNPATKEIRHLPRSSVGCFDYHDDCVTGFGFSPIANNYKIVRTYAKLHDATNRVEVFSLSRGSWKEIDLGNLKGVKLYSETVTANGEIFWFGIKLGAKEGSYDGEVIVSFDIAKEVFTLMPKPNLDYCADESLTVYENKLAILCEIDGDDDESSDLIGLWVMEEGTCVSGERQGWNKIYTSGPCPYILDPMAVWRNEIVSKVSSFEDDDEKRRNVSYFMNVTTNEVKSFVIPCCGRVHSMYNYVESLVSVGNNYLEES